MAIGRVLLGRYRLLSLLGEGGLTTVYRAHDEILNRTVAVKVLRAEFGADPEVVSTFRRQARNAASLNHPNIVPVYDTGSDDGTEFIVMGLAEGEDLDRGITRLGRLPADTSLRIAAGVARALQAAHEHGIVHGGLTPRSILIDAAGGVRVADFGIARAAGGRGIPMAGATTGSAQYVSPEQVLGEDPTFASDLYSLGVVLYEILTGQRPFDGSSPSAVAVERLHVRPAPPSAVAPDLPAGVDPVVMRALEPEPVDRYRSAGEFAAELESWRRRSLDGLWRPAAASREGIRNLAPAGIAAAAVGLGASREAIEDDTVGHAVEAFVPQPLARPSPPDRPQSRPIGRRRSRRYLWAFAPLLPPLGLILLLSLATVAIIAVVGGGRSEARIPGLHEPSLLAVVPTISPSTPPSASLATQPPSPQATPEPSPEPTAAPTSAPTPVPPPAATPRPAPTSPPAPRATPAPTSAPVPGGPADTVARFYRLVAADRFDDAAALWTRAMRDRYPPEQYIDGRFAPTTAIDLRRNEVIAINRAAGTATVAVDLVEYRASGPSPRRFVGDWDLVLVDGRWLMNDPDF